MGDNSILISHSPSEVNTFLKNNFKHDLFQFTRCLVDIFYRNYLSDSFPSNSYNLRQSSKTIEKLKTTILKTLYQAELAIYDYNPAVSPIIERYHLALFFEELSRLGIEAQASYKALNRKKGRELKPKNLVLLLWSYFILKGKRNTVDWETITDLYQWFCDKLKNTPFKKEIHTDTSMLDRDSIRREVYRLKRELLFDKKLKEYIDQCKKEYFLSEDKTKRSTIDIPKLFGNTIDFCIGINLLSPNKLKRTIVFPNGDCL